MVGRCIRPKVNPPPYRLSFGYTEKVSAVYSIFDVDAVVVLADSHHRHGENGRASVIAVKKIGLDPALFGVCGNVGTFLREGVSGHE
jgi:hypothetical protein